MEATDKLKSDSAFLEGPREDIPETFEDLNDEETRQLEKNRTIQLPFSLRL